MGIYTNNENVDQMQRDTLLEYYHFTVWEKIQTSLNMRPGVGIPTVSYIYENNKKKAKKKKKKAKKKKKKKKKKKNRLHIGLMTF